MEKMGFIRFLRGLAAIHGLGGRAATPVPPSRAGAPRPGPWMSRSRCKLPHYLAQPELEDSRGSRLTGGRNTRPLFVSRHSGEYSTRRIQQIVKEVAQSAGIDKQVSPHLLRHTMATRLVNDGMPMEHVRKILEHESADTTRIYAESETASVCKSFRSAMAASSSPEHSSQ